MNSFDSRLIRDIGQRLVAEIAENATRLHMHAAPDYAQYVQRVGHIKGLQKAMALIAEVQQALSSPEDKGRPAPIEHRVYEDT